MHITCICGQNITTFYRFSTNAVETFLYAIPMTKYFIKIIPIIFTPQSEGISPENFRFLQSKANFLEMLSSSVRLARLFSCICIETNVFWLVTVPIFVYVDFTLIALFDVTV